MKKLLFILAALCCTMMSFAVPEGAISGKFSVSADKKVYFSQGNLQYQWYYYVFQFAEHQWDVIGADNTNIGDPVWQGFIDLYGWGTSGYDDKVPHTNSTVSSDYGPATGDIAGTPYDWGSVAETMDLDTTWRTLTKAEWEYLLQTRPNAANLQGKHLLHGVGGLVLLPDNWDLDARPLSAMSDDTWAAWEALGAVFLPSTGYRTGTTVKNITTEANYWTSTRYESDATTAYHLYVPSSGDLQIGHSKLYLGMAVRLVNDVKKCKVTINQNIAEGGSYRIGYFDMETSAIDLINDLSKLDSIEEGTTLFLRPDEEYGYKVVGTELSTEPGVIDTRAFNIFTVNGDMTVTIYFEELPKWKVTIAEVTGGHAEVSYTSSGWVLTDEQLAEVVDGTSLTFKAIPDDGYHFVEWTPNSAYGFTPTLAEGRHIIKSDITVTPVFEKDGFTVTFSAAPSPSLAPAPDGTRRAPMVFGGGHVECVTVPTSGDPVTINSGDEVMAGTVVRFTAVPDALGWTLDYWSTGPATGNSKEVTIDNDYTIVAYFKESAMCTLTLQDDGNGVITVFNGTPGEEVYSAAPINVLEGQEIILTAHPNVGYEFDHWDNYTDPYFDEDLDVWVVPAVTGNTTIKAYFREKATETLAEGAIGGLFTVGVDGEGKPIRVQFSQGNLQYIAGDGKTHKVADETLAESSLARRGTWQFAEEQIDYIGSKNNNAADDYDEPIDIFCFGASGFDSRYPWLKTISALEQDISATNYDFGVFNAISNGGNEPGLWRMLTKDEVDYMLYQRGNHSNCVYWGRQLHGIGTANGEAGLFLMPDGWVMPGELAKENVMFLPLEVEDYVTNRFKSEAWTILEQSGVVFIPAGGARFDLGGGIVIYAVGQALYNQLATYAYSGEAYALGAMSAIPGEFDGGTTVGPFPTGTGGCTVRLVRDIPSAPEGIETPSLQGRSGEATKLIRNGQLLIIRDGKTYNALGVEIK